MLRRNAWMGMTWRRRRWTMMRRMVTRMRRTWMMMMRRMRGMRMRMVMLLLMKMMMMVMMLTMVSCSQYSEDGDPTSAALGAATSQAAPKAET
eukprot:4375019-Pyramimonas_sp.AAC.1